MKDFNMFGLITFQARSRCNLLVTKVLVSAEHGEHLPLSLLLDLISFLLCSTVLFPIICLRLAFLWKAISVDYRNISFNWVLTCKTCSVFHSYFVNLFVKHHMMVSFFTSCCKRLLECLLKSFVVKHIFLFARLGYMQCCL